MAVVWRMPHAPPRRAMDEFHSVMVIRKRVFSRRQGHFSRTRCAHDPHVQPAGRWGTGWADSANTSIKYREGHLGKAHQVHKKPGLSVRQKEQNCLKPST